MSLSTGTRLGPYEIDDLLGAGGMGEVYRARDTRLDRIVAVKVLSAQLADDPQFRERFDREARAISSLSDPHICPLFDVGEADGLRFLVMEYLEGETIAKRLESGAVPLPQSLSYATEIARALDAAHRQGVVHRDLKPGNVMVTRTGTKLLDFGLAKAAAGQATGAPSTGTGRAITPATLATALPTTPANLTAHGAIVGTIQYMSPEQIQGAEADARSDIFAFGALLYEMVTGTKAFTGKNQFTVIGAILDHDPAPPSQLEMRVPAALDRLIRKCLAKDPESRWQTARDLASELEWIAESAARPAPEAASSTVAAPPAPAKVPRVRFLTTVAASLVGGAALAGAITWALVHQAPAPPLQPVHFSIAATGPGPLATPSPFRDIAISPDGTRLVYGLGTNGANGQLMVRAIDQLEAAPLRGLTGALAPFVSPDSKWIGFGTLSELKKVSITGGPPITLCRIQGLLRGASWGTNDTIVFATDDTTTGLLSVPAGGGEPKVLTKPDPKQGELDHVFPFVLPGGEAVLFTITSGSGLDNSQVAALNLKTGQQKILIRGGGHAEYVDPSKGSGQGGFLVYAAAGSLRAVRFNPARLEVLSDPVPIVDQVLTKSSGAGEYTVSREGALVYVAGGAPSSAGGAGPARSLVWVNRQGREEPIKTPPRAYLYLNLSPDGTKLAAEIRDQDNDIWIWNFAHETLTRLTFDKAADSYPVWTPDGKRVIFSSARNGAPNLYWQLADGTGTPERLTTTPNRQVGDSVTPDGSQLLVAEYSTSGIGDVKLLHLPAPSAASAAGTLGTEPLVQTTFTKMNAEVSPDGHWLAYQSNESGIFEVFVRPFPNVNGGRWQVSPRGGRMPRWAPNGRELFFVADGFLMTVPVSTSPTFTAGNPTRVFDAPYFFGNERTYDVSPDGQRFLMIKADSGAAPTPTGAPQPAAQTASMIVVLNWTEELRQRLPAK